MSSFRPDFATEERPFVPLAMGSSMPIETQVGEAFSPESGSGDSSDHIERVEPSGDPAPGNAPNAENGTGPETDDERAAAWSALEAFEEAAFLRGVAEGNSGDRRVDDLCQTLEGAAKELELQGSNAVHSQRDLILKLASEIGQQWVRAELKLDSALFADALDRSIEACSGGESLQMILSPADLVELEAEQAERLESWRASSLIGIDTRADFEPGQFLIESDAVRLDGDPESILAVLREVLREALEDPELNTTEAMS